jgi:hypothetical protein
MAAPSSFLNPRNDKTLSGIPMKTFYKTLVVATALLAAPFAHAWTYTNGHALLIFRQSGLNNVEFDLGDISQFVGKPNGYTAPVSGWNSNLVTGIFGSDLSGVSVILAATTSDTNASPAAWLSSGEPDALPHDYSFPTWRNNLYSVINAVGTRPLTYLVPASGAAAYSIDPGGTYRLASYDYIASGGGVNAGAIQQLGGNVSFNVEKAIPGSFGFWQIVPGSFSTAATYVGTFNIDATGNLSFTAGPAVTSVPQPTILSITRTSTVSTVTFTTANGGNYWLAYSNSVAGSSTNWPPVNGPIPGDGNNHSLNHTNSEANGFYRVVRTP